ncbi:immunoglobulin lambda-1 light chain-like [Leptodactylus fuscus]
MVKVQRFCLLLILIVESRAQHSVTQEPLIITTPRQNVKMPCTLGGGLTVASNRVVFYQQKDHNAPRFILYYDTESSNGKGKDVPSRFVGSADHNVGYMSINGVQLEDDSVYHCATWVGSQWVIGKGTQLVVLTGDVKAPSVSVFIPSVEELETDKATLACTLSDFTPKIVTVEWMVDGMKQTTGVYPSMASKQENNLYMTSSVLTMTAEEYKNHEKFSCKVTHQGKEIIKTINRSECA